MVEIRGKSDVLASVAEILQEQQGYSRSDFQATPVPGYPLFFSWARFSGVETNDRGIRKAYLLLPFTQVGPSPLQKYSGGTNVEQPLDIVMGQITNPYNCKASVAPSLNSNHLKEGNYYLFLMALKPAATSGRQGTIPYWDGHIKAFSPSINGFTEFQQYIELFKSNQTQWRDMQVIEDSEATDG